MNKMVSEAKAGSCWWGEVDKGWGRFTFRFRLAALRLPFWGGRVLSWPSGMRTPSMGEAEGVVQQDWTWPGLWCGRHFGAS